MERTQLTLPVGNRTWWSDAGFGELPRLGWARSGGLVVYRAWGGTSSEWGSGYFSLEKPASVLDAELRFNIADWGNLIRFVSTFRILAGVAFYFGKVGHGPSDLSRPGTQIWLRQQELVNVRLERHAELLGQDAFVSAAQRFPVRLWN